MFSIAWNPSLTDENEAHIIIIITAAMTALIILSTTTRIVMKLWYRMPILVEDVFIVISLVSPAA